MAEEEKQVPQPAKKKLPVKLIAIVAGALIVLGGGGFAAAKLLGGHKTDGPATEGHGKTEAAEVGVVIPLDSFVVNLADTEASRYLKLTLHLELGPTAKKEEIEKHTAQIRDAIITLLGSKTYAEIADVKGKVKLRGELLLRLNDILGEESVRQAYYTEFIVQ
jgi:flagellar FliL protein